MTRRKSPKNVNEDVMSNGEMFKTQEQKNVEAHIAALIEAANRADNLEGCALMPSGLTEEEIADFLFGE